MDAFRDPRTIPDMLHDLKHRNAILRRRAVRALGQFGPRVQHLAGQITPLLDDSDHRVREEAARALGRIGSAPLPAVIEGLGNSNRHVRREAVRFLRQSGSEAGRAVPELAQALRDSDFKVRMGAALALGLLGPEALPAVPDLVAALKDRHRFFCRMVAWALERIGSAALPALTEALGSSDYYVRHNADQLIQEIGQEARSQEPTRAEPVTPPVKDQITPLVNCA